MHAEDVKIDHHDDPHQRQALHTSAALCPKCGLITGSPLSSDLFLRPLVGFQRNGGIDGTHLHPRRASEGLIGLMPLVFVGGERKVRVDDLYQVMVSPLLVQDCT